MQAKKYLVDKISFLYRNPSRGFRRGEENFFGRLFDDGDHLIIALFFDDDGDFLANPHVNW
jgi:hypothetical protein